MLTPRPCMQRLWVRAHPERLLQGDPVPSTGWEPVVGSPGGRSGFLRTCWRWEPLPGQESAGRSRWAPGPAWLASVCGGNTCAGRGGGVGAGGSHPEPSSGIEAWGRGSSGIRGDPGARSREPRLQSTFSVWPPEAARGGCTAGSQKSTCPAPDVRSANPGPRTH